MLRFPLGEEGAHQLLNGTEETVTFLAISSNGRPDVVVYPDSDKIGVGERLPKGGGLRGFFIATMPSATGAGRSRPVARTRWKWAG